MVEGASDLASAGPGELAGVFDRKHLQAAQSSQAGVLIVPLSLAGAFGDRPVLAAAAAKASFAEAMALLYPVERPAAGVHATAVVSPDSILAGGVHIGPHVSIGDSVRIGASSVIGAGAVLMDHVEVGADVWIHPRAVIYPKTVIGDRCVIFAGAVIGAPGFGQTRDEAGRVVRVPHLGRVVLEADVEVGANSTVDRATFGETRLAARARLDNLVQIGHNARVGSDAMIAAQSGISGSSTLGDGAMMGGQSGLADHVTVGAGSAVAAKSAVFSDVGPREMVAGIPAMPISRWRRIVAVQARLPELWKRWSAASEEKGTRGE